MSWDAEAAAARVVDAMLPLAAAARAAQAKSYLKSDLEFLHRQGGRLGAPRDLEEDPAWVAAWTGRHLDQMPGVTFREAVRRLPGAQAPPLQAAYQQARAKLGHCSKQQRQPRQHRQHR